jgi:ubiquinone/menaquinone biosynthesis C-methylase UbiE
MLTKIFAPLINGSPALKRAIWKRWYQFLAGGYHLEDWTFMNYGYASTDASAPPLKLEPADEAERHGIQLYHHVASGAELRGRDVLEVGSGRGGGSSYIARYLQQMIGMDYSANAVELSRKRHNSVPNLAFETGDAEAIPFEAAAFDAVVNVESSHCYGSMERFLSEVYRVLRPNGYFLWVDMRSPDAFETTIGQFEAAGFTVVERENITPNVLRALDEVTEKKRAMIGRHVPKYLMRYFEDFAGVPGTRVYESLKDGRVQYWRCALQKPA